MSLTPLSRMPSKKEQVICLMLIWHNVDGEKAYVLAIISSTAFSDELVSGMKLCFLILRWVFLSSFSSKVLLQFNTITRLVFWNFAVCLDGSPPAYALHKGIGEAANNWVIYLEVCNLFYQNLRLFNKLDNVICSLLVYKMVRKGGLPTDLPFLMSQKQDASHNFLTSNELLSVFKIIT